MAGMGPAYKADVWLSTYAASLAGLVSTVPATAPLDDAWSSAHHYRPLPILHTSHGGQSSAAVDQGGQRAVNGGQGENMPAYGSSPTGVQLDFTLAQNSQYIPLLVFI